MAWVDLLLLANHAPGFFYKRGIRVDIKVGQLGYDIESLAKRWKWSRNKVNRWLKDLENSNQIVKQKTNVTTIISIVNYSIYQGNGIADGRANEPPKGEAKGKAEGHEQEGIRIIKNEKNIVPPTIEMIIDYCNERKNKIDPNYFFDYNEARGWKIKGQLIKDWQATIRYWERNNNSNLNGHNRQDFGRHEKRVNDLWK